jgi:hypothetical protein
MTDGKNGHVYTYNPATYAGSSLPLLTTTSGKAAGEIKFYNGIGYVAMGLNGGGVYYFDPSKSAPIANQIAGTGNLDAEYFAFYSSTQAYVSVVSYPSGCVYTFNPSNLASSSSVVPISGTTGYIQEIIVGPDGMVYAADDSGTGTVLQINPAANTMQKSFNASAAGTTGLTPGIYNGTPGVFVANTGGYSSSYAPQPGSIDFINTKTGTISTVVAASTTPYFYPGRLIQLSNGNLVAVGTSFIYLVALSGTSATVTPLTDSLPSGASYNYSIAYSNGLIYVPVNNYSAYASWLHIFNTNGTQAHSPVSVMTGTDNLANIAFYQD